MVYRCSAWRRSTQQTKVNVSQTPETKINMLNDKGLEWKLIYFCRLEKNHRTWRKTLGVRLRNQSQPRIEPGSQCWKAQMMNTAPTWLCIHCLHVTSLPPIPCWRTITKDSSLASIVSSFNMAAMSLSFDSLGIDCKASIDHFMLCHCHYVGGW